MVTKAVSGVLASVSKRGVLSSLLKTGSHMLTFTAPSAGKLTLDWYYTPKTTSGHSTTKTKAVLVAELTAIAKGPGTEMVKLKLAPAGKALLKRDDHLKITAKATFTPVGGAPISRTRTAAL
jgi:hypothetical protein